MPDQLSSIVKTATNEGKLSESADDADWRRWRKGQADCAGVGAAVSGEAFGTEAGLVYRSLVFDLHPSVDCSTKSARPFRLGIWKSLSTFALT
jgi:hypothetical protein